MKKVFKRITAVLMCSLMILCIPFGVSAHAENSYTYNYDYWGEFTDSPDSYTVASVATSSDLGLENLNNKNMSKPEGLTVVGERIFICDSANNRIIETKLVDGTRLEFVRLIEEFTVNPSIIKDPEMRKVAESITETHFKNPTDLAVSEEGCYFICDKDNARILKLDKDFNFLMQFVKPDDASLDKDLVFKPSKLVIDTADRVYCVATGINKGLVKYEADGTFSGFIGATPVSYNFWDWLWKKFATQEQREQMVNFVPTEYDNLYIDQEGFIYTCTSKAEEEEIKSESIQVVRKLNLLGNDILVRNGNYPIYGDLYMGTGGQITGPSRFVDITTLDNDIYICLDKNRGRLFGYDDQGRLVYVFGGTGNMDGYFKSAAAIDHIGNSLLVLDSLNSTITVFIPTEFGNLIYTAIDQFDQGEYDAAETTWRRVLGYDGNCDLAYIGIGRSLLRQKKYSEAMDYFKLKHDAQNYSKAFKQYRKQWVEDHIVLIVVVILLLFLIPMGIGKLKNIKHEIDTADIFQL